VRNEIEVALSKEQIERLIGKGKGNVEKDQDADAGKPASVVMPPPLPNVGEGHNQVRDQSAFADAAARDKLVPEDVASRYKKDGQKYLDANDPKKVAFVDKGNRLQTSRSFDDKAVEDMVAIADARGMTAFKVS
ncbi:LPD7 domain-containing protein, partial [Mesorhizobium sp. M7A.T.Ca.US.000.02.2.1]|uniref:LPD7 domain-containing protein n=1 Tax=Mesorhizobium sp. M7A.T.Ca.US.000.02.2.1 TaxID=2496793 RepID=UPI00163CBFBE